MVRSTHHTELAVDRFHKSYFQDIRQSPNQASEFAFYFSRST